jgi:putative transposon-encoded protein
MKAKKEAVTNLLLNDVKEYIRFSQNLRNSGLTFVKKVTKFSKTSAAIYLPKRLIGQTFKVMLMPVDDGYDTFERKGKKPEKEEKVMETSKIEKEADKELKKTEKVLEEVKRGNLPGMAPIL